MAYRRINGEIQISIPILVYELILGGLVRSTAADLRRPGVQLSNERTRHGHLAHHVGLGRGQRRVAATHEHTTTPGQTSQADATLAVRLLLAEHQVVQRL